MGRRDAASGHLRPGSGGGAAGRPHVQRAVPLLPGPAERPASRLGARVAAGRVRRRAAAGGLLGGYAHPVISIQLIRDEPDAVRHAIARKGEPIDAIDRLLVADARRRTVEAEANDLRAERNAGNRELGELIRTSAGEAADQLKARMAPLSG